MRRRNFITLLGGTAAIWPLSTRAQQAALPVIGFLNSASFDGSAQHVRAFREGLSETGYVQERNAAMEYRWADGQYDRLPAMAADLARRQVAVISATGGLPSALAAKAATTTIPIVFQVGVDPVAFGLVARMNRPGGNITGATNLNVEVLPKRLELLRELIPTATTMAVLVNPTNPAVETQSRNLQAAASTLGLQLEFVQASTERDFDTVFATLHQMRTRGLVIITEPFFNARSEQIAALALRHAVPTIFQNREFTAAGGLMSYGGNQADAYRLVGSYTGRILKGEKPADLPVMQSTKVELIVNLKTAKALGVTVPLSLLGRADEVVE
jgi:putative ABC transport system substrate-binding protein